METETFAQLISSPRPVLVEFGAEWCGPCQVMAAIIGKIRAMQGEALRIVNVDVDKNRYISAHYSIEAVPTLMIFKNGRQLWRQSGVIQAEELNKVIEMFR